MNKVKVCRLSELHEKEGKRFYSRDYDIAVFKIDGVAHAFSNICPHQKAAIIYDGFIEDNCVVCPSHGWMFDIETGKAKSGFSRLKVYETEISDGEVYVFIPGEKLFDGW